MAYTGIRRGEAIALKWGEVDLERGVVSITETAQRHQGKGIVVQRTKSAAGRRGILPLTQRLSTHSGYTRASSSYTGPNLTGSTKNRGLVFPGPLGGLLDPPVLTRNFEKLAKKAGYIGMRLHDLRHGHAAGLMKAGVYPKTIQERLGHAAAAFTLQVYGHVAAGEQAEAARAFSSFMAAGKE